MSFAKNRLEGVVNELRQHNSDLVTLTSQIQDLGAQRQTAKTTYLDSHKRITHFRTTRQALRKLHSLLARKWTCDEEVQHDANLSLLVLGAEGCQQLSSVVRFRLALTCQPRPTSQNSPVFLDIESSPVESQKPEIYDSKALVNVTATLQNIAYSPSQPFPEASRSINQDTADLSSSNNGAHPVHQSLSTFVDLSGLNTLCKYFHDQLQITSTRKPNMAFIEEATTFKHFVYLQPSSRARSPSKKTLKDVLQDMSAIRKRGALSAKLQLARLLSLGVLRFTSTPWLAETWSSNDIQFFELGENGEDVLSKTPCFTAPLYKQNPLGRNTSRELSLELFIPNTTLYSLGVVLLELGYDAPLQELQCEDDFREGEVKEYTRFRTAKRLGRNAPLELGSRYGQIIQRCLRCDFGVGDNLESVELQNAVVHFVVDELELCMKSQTEVDKILFPSD
jgi:hypothetical protein